MTYAEWQKHLRFLGVVLRKGRLPRYTASMTQQMRESADRLIDRYPVFYARQTESSCLPSKLVEQRLSIDNVRQDLETRLAGADSQREPGGVRPAGVYWNGFHVGISVALELLERLEGGK